MLDVKNLSKSYGSLKAVDDISFSVAPGQVLGFLGPNGAGKTTTMRMIAGFIEPSAGQVSINGFDVRSDAVAARRALGYLPEGAPSYGEMNPRGFLEFIAGIRGLTGNERRKAVAETLDRLQLRDVEDQAIDTLSKGFKRRVGLAQAIIHNPPVLILDEPTDGLDPNQKHEVRTLISEMSADRIIVVSTHILEEVDTVCNRALILADGRILVDSDPAELISRSRFHNAVTVKIGGGSDVSAELAGLPGVASVEFSDSLGSITAFPEEGATILPVISRCAEEQGWHLEQLHLEAGRLDEVFRRITTEGSR